MPRRRILLFAAVTSALVIATASASLFFMAPQPAKIPRIGFLSPGWPGAPDVKGFRQGLEDHGLFQDLNVLIDWRFAEGRTERLPDLAGVLVRWNPDVIVAFTSDAALAAKKEAPHLPIIFALVPDPVSLGLVKDLRQPGRNMTGFSNVAADLIEKRLDMFKQTIPSLKSIIVFTGESDRPAKPLVDETYRIAAKLRLKVHVRELRRVDDLAAAFKGVRAGPSYGVLLVHSPFVASMAAQIIELATTHRIPVMGWDDGHTRLGAVISYGPSNFDMGRRAVTHVAKILSGTRPENLPVEQPDELDLVIGETAAKTLGITIPPSVRLQAANVIH